MIEEVNDNIYIANAAAAATKATALTKTVTSAAPAACAVVLRGWTVPVGDAEPAAEPV